MKEIGAAVAGLYGIVSIALASSAPADAAALTAAGGTAATIDCSTGTTAESSVSKPNTTVTVKCTKSATVEPPTPAKGEDDVFLDAQCTQAGVLSSVCPGATVTPAPPSRDTESAVPKVNVFFPQLPASQQVVCLKCHTSNGPKDCTAVIKVAAAPPQGPQACAVPGTSVTLRINEAGGSAEFACGNDLVLMPSGATTAYADDCTKEEALKDITRSAGTGKYVILKVDKLKRKKLCYLCKKTALAARTGANEDRCTVYVEVGGSTRLSSSVRLGAALPCVVAMLRLI